MERGSAVFSPRIWIHTGLEKGLDGPQVITKLNSRMEQSVAVTVSNHRVGTSAEKRRDNCRVVARFPRIHRQLERGLCENNPCIRIRVGPGIEERFDD